MFTLSTLRKLFSIIVKLVGSVTKVAQILPAVYLVGQIPQLAGVSALAAGNNSRPVKRSRAGIKRRTAAAAARGNTDAGRRLAAGRKQRGADGRTGADTG